MRKTIFLLACAGAVLASSVWLWRLATRRSDVSFLPHHRPAEWIVYPRPPLAQLQGVAELPCVFRRSFALDQVPRSAQLSIRACRRCIVEINGSRIPGLEETNNWKRAQVAEVARFLKSGDNSIVVIAFNRLGPPALWLNLNAGKAALNSDITWESSFAGAVWRPARLADDPPSAAEGNPLRGGEKTLPALRSSWRVLAVIGLFATAMVLGLFKVQGSRFIFLRPAGRDYGGQEVQSSNSHSPTHPLTRSPSPASRPSPHARRPFLCDPAQLLMVVIAILWIALVVHNLDYVPRNAGFDAFGHMEYIQHIQAKGTLPAGNEGWEMHQPPLYYSAAATLLNALHLTPDISKGLAVLRLFSLAVGLVHIIFIFGSLKLLFPGQTSLQLAGLLFAGFLPMQLYLVHYVTNETFASCLVSGTIYLVLKLLREQQEDSGNRLEAHSWFLYLAVGVCLGLALLSKITALIVAPFVLGTMWWPVLGRLIGRTGDAKGVVHASPGQRPGYGEEKSNSSAEGASHNSERFATAELAKTRPPFLATLFPPLASTLACLAVCGWYFRDVWKEFGNPFFAATKWAYAVGWWQDPGYRTAAYFSRFGRSFTDPLLGGVASFADGIYSTLWGDGYCGGLAQLIYRPPWNYNLMVIGYLLALIPMSFVLLGFARSLLRMIREPDLAWIVLVGFTFAMVLAIVHLNLMVPAYPQAKAFFGHSALIAVSAFVAMGWRFLENRRPSVRMAAAILLAFWAMISYASFWVRGNSAQAQASVGHDLMNEGKLAMAFPHLRSALEQDSTYAPARSFLVSVLCDSGQLTNAADLAREGVKDQPDRASCHMDLARVLDRQGRMEGATSEIRRAVELAPDSPEGRLQLASHLLALHRYTEAITACREALRVRPTDPEVHNVLAYSLLNLARTSAVPPASVAEDCLSRYPDLDHISSSDPAPPSTADTITASTIAHFRLVTKLAPRSADPLNALAWILSTYPRAELRNGVEALELAQKSCGITKESDPEMLATLAAAHAENGQFSQAVQAAEKAARLQITNAGSRERIERMTESFRANRPYREQAKQ